MIFNVICILLYYITRAHTHTHAHTHVYIYIHMHIHTHRRPPLDTGAWDTTEPVLEYLVQVAQVRDLKGLGFRV